jgi:hypothetical protein
MKRTGSFLGIPYVWHWPTWAGIKERLWNPQDPRIFTPPALIWGWSINRYEVLRRIGIMRQGDQ